MSGERWLPVAGYEGIYEVSDRGRVRSLDRVTTDGKHLRGTVLQPYTMPTGHLRVRLCTAGAGSTRKVHRLVLAAFVGPPPPNSEVLHRDGVPSNNVLSNLRWGDKSENTHDQVAHGVHLHARKTHCPAGHPYDAENTFMNHRRGSRKCRECNRQQQRAAYRARRAA